MNIYIALFATGLLALLPGCGKKNNKVKESHKKEVHTKKSKKMKKDIALEALDLGDMDQFSTQSFDADEHDADLLSWDQQESMRRTPEGQFKAVYFDFNKYDVRPDQQAIVDEDTQQAQKVLKNNKHKKLVVEGHASKEKRSTGGYTPRAYNMMLSQKRAEKVKAEHVKKGISADQIVTVGRGQEMPVRDTTSVEDGWINRRVEEFAIDN